jgi:hypothetical protein
MKLKLKLLVSKESPNYKKDLLKRLLENTFKKEVLEKV